MRRLLLLAGTATLRVAVGLALATGAAQAQGVDSLWEQGRQVYLQGVLPGGQPVRAEGAGSTTLEGTTAACVQCHRRSGMGSREGSLAIPAIAGPMLFAKPVVTTPRRLAPGAEPVAGLRQETRAAYDDATLARALREGLDASGRPLNALMPRYDLDAATMQALTRYLRQLSAAPVVGLQDGVLHLATVISPDADPLRAATLKETLQTWVRSGPLGGIPMDLQIWQLSGPPGTWQQQLQENQRRQPVYALLLGAGRAEWTPVRDFCEQAALPCLFPLVDLAPMAAEDFYTVYFSRGVPLEAQMLARHLREAPTLPRTIQIYSDAAGQAAAALLDQAMEQPRAQAAAHKANSRASVTRAWSADQPASLLADAVPGDAVVLWLRPAEVAALVRALPEGPVGAQAYLSAQLAAPQNMELPPAWRAKTRWVSVRSDPQRLVGKSVMGLVPWAAHLQLPLTDRALLSEIYAATYFFADALARMRGNWNQDFLLETLENANFGRPAGAAFFTLSLAPGQREAAKGGHLLGYAGPDDQAPQPVSARITP